jgi:hypothetical protein
MKTILTLLLCALLAGPLPAGEVTIFNDTILIRLVKVSHKGQKLGKEWLKPGESMVVQVDETRRGSPILTMVSYELLYNSYGSESKKREFKSRFAILPKRPEPKFVLLSWVRFGAGEW